MLNTRTSAPARIRNFRSSVSFGIRMPSEILSSVISSVCASGFPCSVRRIKKAAAVNAKQTIRIHMEWYNAPPKRTERTQDTTIAALYPAPSVIAEQDALTPVVRRYR